ncbi:MAG: carbamoyltransferase HypF [Thermodesulfobacteriota bacterium]
MTRSATPDAGRAGRLRWRIDIRGVVQGVGFRPFVHREAVAYHLTGKVVNTGQGVVIEAQGDEGALSRFVAALRSKAPAAAVLQDVTISPLPLVAETAFAIGRSEATGSPSAGIPADLALCPECLAELFDPGNRRFRYPFINCTNCGPRYTITRAIPYDRPQTSMAPFSMCNDCRAEYEDPADRRFHAQPNACPSCGPHLWLADAAGQRLAEREAAVAAAAERLQAGAILALKGIGGFHLAVDAANHEAVQRLRQRKGREEKPLAVMVRDPARARQLCRLTAAEEALLDSAAAPIVLAPKQPGHGLSPAVAPKSDRFGVMLAYAPLHHLLLAEGPAVLVMTSGNPSEEPICIDNQEALQRLAGIADFFLCHDRDILSRADDSVLWHLAGETRTIRRARGHVPRPILLAADGPAVLGVGGELKNTICCLKGDQAWVSQHLGDLKSLEGFAFFRETVAHLGRIYEVTPELVAHDLHPAYLSTRWAREQDGVPRLGVQHHHAHLAACLGENRHAGPAIGVILDGTGYGTDGTIWGGEVLIGDCREFRRFAHLAPMPLPGGDAAVAEPWRAGVGYLHAAYGGAVPELPFLQGHDVGALVAQLARRINCPETSSCGRLFDAVAAIAGGRPVIRYEAQAAIEFMQAGARLAGPAFPFELDPEHDTLVVAVAPLVRAVAEAVRGGATVAEVSARFHLTLVELFLEVVRRAAAATGLGTVALSGGVLQNHLLFVGLAERLQAAGFTVLTHGELPANDGCIAFGQAVVGRAWLMSRPKPW